jgi:asparagine synthase (glutamine-hydrolysing)
VWRTYLHHLQIWDPRSFAHLGLTTRGRAEELVRELWHRYPGQDFVGRRQFIDQHTYLPDQILALTDRMSMATSLEVRVPFLDYRLVALAAGVSGDRKQAGRDFKLLLKEALGSRVPVEVLSRRKWGFDSPIRRWLQQPVLRRSLQHLPHALRDVLDSRETSRLVRSACRTGSRAREVWGLLTLAVWRRVHHLAGPPDQALDEVLADA